MSMMIIVGALLIGGLIMMKGGGLGNLFGGGAEADVGGGGEGAYAEGDETATAGGGSGKNVDVSGNGCACSNGDCIGNCESMNGEGLAPGESPMDYVKKKVPGAFSNYSRARYAAAKRSLYTRYL